jgi:hypothetical protein
VSAFLSTTLNISTNYAPRPSLSNNLHSNVI